MRFFILRLNTTLYTLRNDLRYYKQIVWKRTIIIIVK